MNPLSRHPRSAPALCTQIRPDIKLDQDPNCLTNGISKLIFFEKGYFEVIGT